jgi:DNA-binding transcriptional MerR regulator
MCHGETASNNMAINATCSPKTRFTGTYKIGMVRIKGNRQFTKEDIDNVRTIYHLVKEKGFTLQGAKDMLKNDAQSVRDKMEMIDSLKSIRTFLVELRERI